MASALQQQLAAIAANSTHQLDLKAQRAAHGRSLLFDSKVAVSQDFDTLYQICVEGFEELCSLDSRFLQYAQNFYHEQSKVEERGLWTADQNKDFDQVLQDFLGLVQPRLLLKPAQKSLEWLIRRFRIHEYNTELVILTLLPYHSTSIFQSLLSIVPQNKISATFRFLKPYATTLSNPPFTTIVHTAIHNAAFTAALNQFFLNVCRSGGQSSVLIAFWASLMSQAVEGMLNATHSGRQVVQRERTEQVLLRLLPVLNEALSFVDLADVSIGCCMIITVLASRGDLEDTVLNGLMEAVASHWSSLSIEPRLACLATLAQYRQTTKLPKAIVKRMLALQDLGGHIVRLSDICRSDRLASGLLLGSIDRLGKRSSGREMALIDTVVRAHILDEHQLNAVIRSLTTFLDRSTSSAHLLPEEQALLGGLFEYLTESDTLNKTFENALKKSGVKRDAVEMALQRTLTYPAVADGSVPKTIVEVVIPKHPESYSLALESASKLAAPTSFLSPNVDGIFEELLHLLLRAIGSPEAMDQFIEVNALQRSKAEDEATYLSFFVRVWSSECPVTARVTALRTATALLNETYDKDIDFQMLIPYLCFALSDRSPVVRRAGADTLQALGRQYKAFSKNSKSVKVWCTQKLHPGNQHHIHSLPTEDAKYLVRKILIPRLEACALDNEVAFTVLGSALKEHSTGQTAAKDGLAMDLKSGRQMAYFSFFAEFFSLTPYLAVQQRFAAILHGSGKARVSKRSVVILPVVKRWIHQTQGEAMNKCRQGKLTAQEVSDNLIGLLEPREQESIEILQQIASGTHAVDRLDVQFAAFRHLKYIWPSVQPNNRQALALELFNVATQVDTDRSLESLSENSTELLQKLSLSTDVLAALLASLPKSSTQQTTQSVKRRRTGRGSEVNLEPLDPSLLARDLRRYTFALELVDGAKPATHPELLKPLFLILGEIQHYRTQTDSELVYLQGLVINSLLAIVEKANATSQVSLDKSEVRTDLLVDCVRNTNSVQVQNAALLLISGLAVWVPELVLHSVMPIFTFMGATILRQSDDYSAHVIDQTVARVLPPLVTSLKKKSRRVITGASDLLLSFTAAFEHMPQSRRLILFQHVIQTLGPSDCLFAVVSMIIDRYPTDSRAARFTVDLVQSFEPAVKMHALSQVVELVADMFKPRRDISETVLHLKGKAETEKQDTAANLLSAISGLVNDQALRSSLSKSLVGENPSAQQQRQQYGKLVQDTIALGQAIRNVSELQSRLSAALTSMFRLPPLPELIQSADTLLSTGNEDVCLALLKSIEAQIQEGKAASTTSRQVVLEFVPRLTDIIESTQNPSIVHAALSLLDQIVERFGKQNTDIVLAATPIVLSRSALGRSDESSQVLALLCLATIIAVTRDECISIFPEIAKSVAAYAEQSLSPESARPRLFEAAFAVTNALLDHLPFIVGDLLPQMLGFALRASESEIARSTQVTRQHFYKLIVAKLDAAEGFVAMRTAYPIALNEGFDAMAEIFKLLRDFVDSQKKSIILKNSSKLFEMLLTGLGTRQSIATEDLAYDYDGEEIDQLENLLIEITTSVTMKLNDATFRPFFTRLVDWASAGSTSKEQTNQMLRSTTLFRLLRTLFERLKSLITSYASYVIDLAVVTLQTAPQEGVGGELLLAVLGALEQSFEHDDDDFWQSPAHFEAMVTPLLGLLPRVSTDESLLPATITAIVGLASAASSSEHHKTLNSLLLAQLREDQASARLAAVKCEAALTEKLAEEWLDLLPELLPVVVELMEDDDEEVEMASRRWVGRIESILGEKLDDMLQ